MSSCTVRVISTGRCEAAIAGVADVQRVQVPSTLQRGIERPRVVAQAPEVVRLAEPVQLLAVDLDGVVRSGRPEAVAPLGRARVGERAGVEQQRDAVERRVERRDVVVAVAAAAGEPDGAAVDEDVVVAAAQHRAAAVGEDLRLGRRCVDERRGSGRAEEPGDLGSAGPRPVRRRPTPRPSSAPR